MAFRQYRRKTLSDLILVRKVRLHDFHKPMDQHLLMRIYMMLLLD